VFHPAALFLVIAMPLATPVASQSTKLSAPFPFPGGSISSFELTPDGRWVVYLGDQEKDDVFRLYVVPADGSSRPRPLDRFVPSGDVRDFRISPAGERVVYRADHDTDGVLELYSVPVDGSKPPRRLNGPLVPGGNVEGLSVDFPAFELGGGEVVYRADQDQDGVFELFGAPLDGSAAAVKLNGPLEPGRQIRLFQIARDGSRVAYTADFESLDEFELSSATMDGAVSIVISAELAPGGDVLGFEISPDSRRIVYLADQDANDLFELFGVPLDGSEAPRQISGSMVTGGDVQEPYFRITPDGQRVVYLADQDENDVFELFSAPVDGSQPAIQLNRPLLTGGDAVLVGFENQGFQISPDSRRVVYQADGGSTPVELHSALVAVPRSSVRISAPYQPFTSGTRMLQFQISPDSSRVVYRAERPTAGRLELYGTSIADDGSVVKLNEPLPSQGQTYFFAIGPDSRSVVYTADQEASFTREIFGVPIDHGRPARKLNDALVPGGNVLIFPVGFRITPDGRRVLYLADQDTRGVRELYTSSLSVERHPASPSFSRR
jgi:Tol biopolymer transport system component